MKIQLTVPEEHETYIRNLTASLYQAGTVSYIEVLPEEDE